MCNLKRKHVAMMGVKLLLDVITKINKTMHYAVQLCFSNGKHFRRGLSKIVKDSKWTILWHQRYINYC